MLYWKYVIFYIRMYTSWDFGGFCGQLTEGCCTNGSIDKNVVAQRILTFIEFLKLIH